MSELVAKPIVKNKFWVVENSGKKIATIQAKADGGFVYVHDDHREHFPSVKNLKQKYQIEFRPVGKSKKDLTNDVYGFPVNSKAYNQVYDVIRKLPVYSKNPKSKSLFCAGYYLIKQNNNWELVFCPKNITVNRYEYYGPFKSKDETENYLKRISNATG